MEKKKTCVPQEAQAYCETLDGSAYISFVENWRKKLYVVHLFSTDTLNIFGC